MHEHAMLHRTTATAAVLQLYCRPVASPPDISMRVDRITADLGVELTPLSAALEKIFVKA